MGWVYLDDSFPEHSKMIAAGGDAVLLWIYGLAYCNRRLTEGRIPKAYVPQLTDRRKPLDLAAKLVKVGLWLDDRECYRVHDYDKWNHSATAKAKAKRAADARWKDKPKPDAQAHAQASTEHVPEAMLDGVLGDASRAPGPHLPKPPVVTSTSSSSSVEQASDEDEICSIILEWKRIAAADTIRSYPAWRPAVEAETRSTEGPRIRAARVEHPTWPAEQMAAHLRPDLEPPRLRIHRAAQQATA